MDNMDYNTDQQAETSRGNLLVVKFVRDSPGGWGHRDLYTGLAHPVHPV